MTKKEELEDIILQLIKEMREKRIIELGQVEFLNATVNAYIAICNT